MCVDERIVDGGNKRSSLGVDHSRGAEKGCREPEEPEQANTAFQYFGRLPAAADEGVDHRKSDIRQPFVQRPDEALSQARKSHSSPTRTPGHSGPGGVPRDRANGTCRP